METLLLLLRSVKAFENLIYEKGSRQKPSLIYCFEDLFGTNARDSK